eukprot:GHVL01023282.1.p2 GENE.GHVL01023282.1~~GHVL01023282.1.p2  ORF type:complete len:125 (+),score=7.97 GHVL01023282.1:343-717(+)
MYYFLKWIHLLLNCYLSTQSGSRKMKSAPLTSHRLYRQLLYIRGVLEWFPQLNPYQPPAKIVFQITSLWMKLWKALTPTVHGNDISSFVSTMFLDYAEGCLFQDRRVSAALEMAEKYPPLISED